MNDQTTQDDFKVKVINYIKNKYPDFEIESRKDFNIDVKSKSGTHHLYLDNLYKSSSQNNFTDWEEQLEKLLIEPKITSLSYEEVKNKVFPMIKNAEFVSAANSKVPEDQHLLSYHLMNGLFICWVVDLPEQMNYVSQKQLKEWGIPRDELVNITMKNLESLPGSDRLRVKKLENGASLIIFDSKDGYDATRLLLLQNPENYNVFANRLGENFIVAIPHRDLLVAAPYQAAQPLSFEIEEEYKKSPYNIIPNLLIITKEGPVVWTKEQNN